MIVSIATDWQFLVLFFQVHNKQASKKTEQGIANQLQLKLSWQAREYMAAMRVYSGVKVMQIIGEIRYCDAKSKGVDNSSLSDGDLLRELVYKILHW